MTNDPRLNPEDPIGYSRHYRIMVVPLGYSGDYDWDEARPATLVDLALAGVQLAPLEIPPCRHGKNDGNAPT